MAIHVAILKPIYIRAILDGRKTIESRLTIQERPPYGVMQPGERLFIKASGGPFKATAIAGKVTQFNNLTPKRVESLRRRYQKRVGGDNAYWQSKRSSRFAVFVTLHDVSTLDVGPVYPKVNMKAWHVLDDSASPMFEITLTQGAIHNRYVSLGRDSRIVEAVAPMTLIMPDGKTVLTKVARGAMLRWRGWGAYYKRHGMLPGDRVRFVATGPRTYRVTFHPSHAQSTSRLNQTQQTPA